MRQPTNEDQLRLDLEPNRTTGTPRLLGSCRGVPIRYSDMKPHEHDQQTLLDDLVVEEDPEYRKKILDAQRAKMSIGQKRTGTHVSDLLMCIRKAWAERYSDEVYDPPDKTVLTWMRGLSHEDLTSEIMDQVRVGYCFRCDDMWPWDALLEELQSCPKCQDTLMVGTVDWVTIDGDELDYSPVEMKSTLKSARKKLIDMAWYADQCKTYMMVHKKPKGRIGVFHMMGAYKRDDPDEMSTGPDASFVVYRIQWKAKDVREAWRQTLLRRKTKFEDLNHMPPIDEDSPGRHPMICQFCLVGERLPTGQECELWPYRRLQDGTYVKKDSNKKDLTMDEMLDELRGLSDDEHKVP